MTITSPRPFIAKFTDKDGNVYKEAYTWLWAPVKDSFNIPIYYKATILDNGYLEVSSITPLPADGTSHSDVVNDINRTTRWLHSALSYCQKGTIFRIAPDKDSTSLFPNRDGLKFI